jgi:cytochrome c oxidase subunit 1
MLFVSLFFNTGPDAGWTSYVPLAGPQFSPGKRVDIWSQMISLTEISALVSAVEIIVTIFKQRAAGMAISRMPLYCWSMLVTSFLVIFGMPAVMLASGMLALDRLTNVNTHFFNPAEGGDALLYQHVFWFFGHPEVYIIFIPATGFVSEIISALSRRPVFGYSAIVLSLVATGFISFGLWVHHMFATPIPRLSQSFFTGASELIAIPSGVQIFCWTATLWLGRPRLRTPMLFVLGFIALFVLGGMTGVMLGQVSLDRQVHDTYFVVAHFHYVLIGGSVFPLLGAVYFWFPKWTGRLMDEGLGKLNFWLFFIGFNITFFPMHILGLRGMPRRVYTYLPETGWGTLNLLATAGSWMIAASVVVLLVNALRSARAGAIAGADPWGAPTLEWATTSPPPRYNFMHLPTVTGKHPMWEQGPETPVVVGLRTDVREVLNTTVLDARPDHRYELKGDSVWPLILALVIGAFFVGVVFTPWAFPIGVLATMISLFCWFWAADERGAWERTPRTGAAPAGSDPTTPIFSAHLPGRRVLASPGVEP